ncbi:hypothetical protein [Rhodococcus ruber]|uniref:hypothetical protein n=1 Tax=Rhodococcus ruber TaxID=1830 RepID=UPI000E6B11BA|nr:hypothetical protein [Rhodococcus ruber]AXY51651.1 hypothetical protein YT1_2223 [Rhodococcus ruber]
MRIEVEFDGVRDLQARLTVAGKNIRRLPRAFRDIGNRIHKTGYAESPVYGGQTRNSIRPRSSNLNAKVSAGGSATRSHGGGVYVELNHYGKRWRGQRPNKWLYRALFQNADYGQARLEREIDTTFTEAGL